MGKEKTYTNSVKDSIMWSDRKRWLLFGVPFTFTKYSLSKDRLFVETGLLNSHENEVRLYRIVDVSLTQTFFQKIVGIGTIKCSSSDRSLKDFEIKNIKNPKEVKEMLSEHIEAERVKKRVSSREFIVDVEDDMDDHDDIDGDDDHDDN